jgi:hypothetical protein
MRSRSADPQHLTISPMGDALNAASEGWAKAFGKRPSALTASAPLAPSLHTLDRTSATPHVLPSVSPIQGAQKRSKPYVPGLGLAVFSLILTFLLPVLAGFLCLYVAVKTEERAAKIVAYVGVALNSIGVALCLVGFLFSLFINH